MQAAGSASGDLGGGGQVRGDISKAAGETDRITVTLDQGATLTLRFSASFAPRLLVTGPDGAPVDVGVPVRGRLTIQNRPIVPGGTYELAVSSADGSQGTYALAVKARWARAIPIAGNGPTVVDVAMPAGGTLAGVVRGAPGAGGGPTIASLADPTERELLTAPITGGRTVKVPPTPAPGAGTYHLAIDTTTANVAWRGRLTRALAKTSPVRLVLNNGLDTVSYAGDGVRTLFSGRCASCHGWANSYAGVRAYASAALGRIRAGSMPPGGRLASVDVALVREWIQTGKQP